AGPFRKPPGLGQGERLEVVVMAAGGGTPSTALKAELHTYLLARAQPGVVLTVSDYTRLTFRLTLKIRIYSASYDSHTVQDAVLAAVLAAFTEEHRQLGQTLYRGEIYQVVDGVAGVENSDCSILLAAYTEENRQLAHVEKTQSEVLAAWPAPGQCLVFDSTDFKLSVEEYRS
ncbi:MAG: baseplate J/gp47 family protein, partial [Pseudomonadota bacterium]